MMEYKGYVAAVEFDESAGRLHGRVVNSGAYPIATFEAPDGEGIRREFQRSIDEYQQRRLPHRDVRGARRRGNPARVPAVDRRVPRVVLRRRGRAEEAVLGHLNLRLGPDLHQRAALSATAHGVSLNSWIKQAVEEKASR